MVTPIAYSSTFILGALHALEPGHGKTFLATYVVGQKINVKHLVALGVSMLLSHFLTLSILAVVLKIIFLQIDTVTIHHTTRWLGPALIIAFGTYLLIKYYRHNKTQNAHTCNHTHGFKLRKPTLTQTALVGMISGLLPCPTAIAPLMLSGIENNFSNALIYILIYVVGMSLVMVTLIGIFYFMKNTLMDKLDLMNNKFHPQLAGASLVLLVGVVYLFLGLAH